MAKNWADEDCLKLIYSQSESLAYVFQNCIYSLLYRTKVPIHIDNVESTDDSIRMVLVGFKA